MKDYSHIKAELLFNYLYPHLKDTIIVENRGLFYRNYQDDILSLDIEKRRLELSRESFLKLLPAALLSEDKQKGIAQDADQKRRNITTLKGIFTAIDTIRFRDGLEYERYFAQLYDNKIGYMLKSIHNFDLESQSNRYIRLAAPLILLSRRIRGDMGLIKDLLSTILECKVELKSGHYHNNSWPQLLLPQATYIVDIADLSGREYRELKEELDPFFNFIREWFMPIEIVVDFRIKDKDSRETLKDRLTLGYNSKLRTRK